jgi:putative (di)nucleoside polyphosphate hydrolase
MTKERTDVFRPEQFFRAGAAAVIRNASGLILCFERIDTPGAWQLPQGGLKEHEEPLQGIYREIFEETALPPDQLELLTWYPEPLAYELPAGLRNAKNGRGQVLYCFLFHLVGTDTTIDLARGEEFRSWKWISFQGLLTSVVEFRRPVYRRLAEWFQTMVS